MTVDINKSIRTAVDTGEIKVGLRETKKAYMAGTLKVVIVAKNCPNDHTEEIELWDVPILRFHSTNLTLGSVCGKPFTISVLGVIDPGKSKVMDAVDV
jgi:large subunit ribosomal protein L30e